MSRNITKNCKNCKYFKSDNFFSRKTYIQSDGLLEEVRNSFGKCTDGREEIVSEEFCCPR